MKRISLVGAIALFAIAPAFAQVVSPAYDVYYLDGKPVAGDSGAPRVPGPNEIYSVYSGIATAAGNLGLIDLNPPSDNDLVAYDGVLEPINPYAVAAGSIQRTVNEILLPNTPAAGQTTLVITIAGRTPAGGPGDLWPAGFTVGGVAATSGGVGLGLNLGAALGSDPLLWGGGATVPVVSGALRIATSGVFGAPLALPLATFFGNGNWNGLLGIVVGNGATGTGIQDILEITIVTSKIPEPATLALLSTFGLFPILRRRGK